jgi:hypothetical protein
MPMLTHPLTLGAAKVPLVGVGKRTEGIGDPISLGMKKRSKRGMRSITSHLMYYS